MIFWERLLGIGFLVAFLSPSGFFFTGLQNLFYWLYQNVVLHFIWLGQIWQVIPPDGITRRVPYENVLFDQFVPWIWRVVTLFFPWTLNKRGCQLPAALTQYSEKFETRTNCSPEISEKRKFLVRNVRKFRCTFKVLLSVNSRTCCSVHLWKFRKTQTMESAMKVYLTSFTVIWIL